MTTPTSHRTASRLTPAGRGAIAVIRICSTAADDVAAALFRPANGRPWSQLPLARPIYGRWGLNATEDVVVCRLSEGEFEIQCHGGDAAVRRILGDLAELGVVTIGAEVQTAVQLDLLDRELQTALMRAPTWRAANYLIEQAHGIYRTNFQRLSQSPRTDIERAAARALMESLLAWSDFGLHLSQPWSVVLTGRPNVGKSSLINALLGYRRAIVADLPGTTRDVVSSVAAFDGWPVELADTAGLRAPSELLEAGGMELARNKLAGADVQVLLIDTSEPPQPDDWDLLSQWSAALVVAHKCDLPNQWGDHLPKGAMRVSSRTGAGLDKLIDAIVQRIVPSTPLLGTPLPVTSRQVQCLQKLLSALDAQDDHVFDIAARQLLDGEPGASATGGVGAAHLLLQ